MEIGASIAALSIRRGTVFHSTMFEEIDHGKFFVVIGENDKELVGFFFINSWINSFIQRKPEMLKLQFPISDEDYDFLSLTLAVSVFYFIDILHMTRKAIGSLVSSMTR